MPFILRIALNSVNTLQAHHRVSALVIMFGVEYIAHMGNYLKKPVRCLLIKKNEFPVLVIPRVWLTGAVIKEHMPVPRPNTYQYLHFGEVILPEIPEIITSTFEYKVLEKESFSGLLNKLG